MNLLTCHRSSLETILSSLITLNANYCFSHKGDLEREILNKVVGVLLQHCKNKQEACGLYLIRSHECHI